MAERVFQVGDVCRIRQWDDMAEEFGGGKDGWAIRCTGSFPKEMRYLCGQRFTIRDINGVSHRSVEGLEDTRPGDVPWLITSDMLEYDPDEDPAENLDETPEDLSCYQFTVF